MPHIYPPSAPVLTGDTLQISRFLADPTKVQRRLREISAQRFIADFLLSGRYEASGGAILYEVSEGIYTDRTPSAINAGGEFPRTPITPGAAALAAVTKWGQDVPVTDEHIKRYGRRAIDTAMVKIRNQMVRQVDTVSLAAIAAGLTQTQAASAAWSNASADPFLDVMLALAQVEALDQEYEPNVLVVTDLLYARLVANQKVIAGLQRETTNTVTATGEVTRIAGLTLVQTNRMPAGTSAFLADTERLGGLGYERLESPEYQGDPANGIETFTRRDPDANDQWLLRGRRPVVPVVQEPACTIKITGV